MAHTRLRTGSRPDEMVNVRISRIRWEAVCEVAQRESRSATVQLGLIVDRGLGVLDRERVSSAERDLVRLEEERVGRVMSDSGRM